MLRRFFNAAVDILYPPICLVCKGRLSAVGGSAFGGKGKPSVDSLLCRDCWGKIKKNLPPFCLRCGRHLDMAKITKNICPLCIKRPLDFDRAFSPCLYEGVVKQLVLEFKYKNKDYLGLILSRLMIEFMKEYNLPMEVIDYIVPVPLHKIRLREREFNQAQILSDYIAEEFNKPTLNDALNRLQHTKTQTELEEEQRFLNIKGSFSVSAGERIKGKNILLVDDVLTTGATTSEVAYVLKNAGAHIVFVLTLAN